MCPTSPLSSGAPRLATFVTSVSAALEALSFIAWRLMRKTFMYIVSAMLIVQMAMAQTNPLPLEISLKHNDQREQQTKAQLKDDELLLSTFVHEQLHWYLSEKPKETEEAYKERRSMFPKVPVGFPEGANDEESTYKHILVCYLEFQAVKGLLGELKRKQVMEFWTTDHYTWIYETVLERERDIGALVRKHKLAPIRSASR